MTRRSIPILFTVAAAGALALSGCSSSGSDASPSPSPTQTTATASPTSSPTSSPTASPASKASMSPSASPSASICNPEAMVAELPGGAEAKAYTCAAVDDTAKAEYWGAIRVEPGPTVFFLRANTDRTKWENVEIEEEICGTASAGLPPQVLDYCN